MYVLGTAYLDTEKQLLVMAERTVALQRKPYLVLLHLIENRHRMITREELLERFWEGQEVYDQSVSKAIGSIRKAFGETRESARFIETRWGGGYRYVGPFGVAEGAGPMVVPSSPVESVEADESGYEGPASGSNNLDRDYEGSVGRAEVAAKTEAADPEPKSSKRTLGVYLVAAVLTVAAVLGIFGVERWKRATKIEAATGAAAYENRTRSVAVLPFRVDQGGAEDTYLGLGFSDAIADRLKTVEQLTVRSSSTIRTVLGTEADAKAAAQRLRVQAIVDGSLHREAGKIVVKVRVL